MTHPGMTNQEVMMSTKQFGKMRTGQNNYVSGIKVYRCHFESSPTQTILSTRIEFNFKRKPRKLLLDSVSCEIAELTIGKYKIVQI